MKDKLVIKEYRKVFDKIIRAKKTGIQKISRKKTGTENQIGFTKNTRRKVQFNEKCNTAIQERNQERNICDIGRK